MNKLVYSVLYNTNTEEIISGHGEKTKVFEKLIELNEKSKSESWIIKTMIDIDDDIYNILRKEF